MQAFIAPQQCQQSRHGATSSTVAPLPSTNPVIKQVVGESGYNGGHILACTAGVTALVALPNSQKRRQHRAMARQASSGNKDVGAAVVTPVQTTAAATTVAPAASEDVEKPDAPDEKAQAAEEGAQAQPELFLACPVCQGELSDTYACSHCEIRFPKETEGNFVDLTITAAEPLENGTIDKPLVKKTESAIGKEDGLLQKLPGVKQLDEVAKVLRLPTSTDVEGLAREVVRDVQRVVPRPTDGALSVTTFQSPLVSFAYERGWRQQFEVNGFPGPDEEYRLAKAFLEEPLKARSETERPPVLLDCSCGSGLFTRRFAGDENLGFAEVIALDFSESMLRQTDAYAAKEAGPTYSTYSRPLRLVRGDVGRLPIQTGSLAGAHAGAAIHCWPAPELGLAELARVLEPGAALVLSTFRPRVRGGRLALQGGNGGTGFRFWEEEQLRTLMRQVGLVNFEAIQKDPAFIMVKAEKPKDV